MRTRPAALATAVFAAALLLGGCGDDDGGGAGSADAEGGGPVELPGQVNNEGTEDATGTGALDLAAGDFFFEPTFVRATPGSTLTVTVDNQGDTDHTFTVDDQEIDAEVEPGASADVEVTVPDDGTVNFYCRFHLAQGMQGAVFTGGADGAGGGDPGQPDDTGGTDDTGGGFPGY